MITEIGEGTLEETHSTLLIGLENELNNLQEYISYVKASESIPESDKRMLMLSNFHDAIEISKLVNLATIAVKLAHISSVKNGDSTLVIPLTMAVDVINTCNLLALSKIKII
jgi:hypothetical protein